MKKALSFAILFFQIQCSFANTVINIPNDFVKEITKIIDYTASLNFIEKLVLEQAVKNSSVNGIKLKKCNSKNLIKYFSESGAFKKTGSDKLVEPYTGATLQFKTDGKCKKQGKCAIIVDLNGAHGPNENWTKYNIPKDRVILDLKQDRSGLHITIPELK